MSSTGFADFFFLIMNRRECRYKARRSVCDIKNNAIKLYGNEVDTTHMEFTFSNAAPQSANITAKHKIIISENNRSLWSRYECKLLKSLGPHTKKLR